MPDTNKMRYDIFISAYSADRFVAGHLRSALEQMGYAVFYSPGQESDEVHDPIPAGKPLPDAIAEANAQSRFMVPLLSQATKASNWVRDEVNMRLAMDSRNGPKTLLPVYLDKDGETEWRDLLGHLRGEMFDRADREAIGKLAARLKDALGRPLRADKPTGAAPDQSLSDLLREVEAARLDHVFDDVRLELARDLRKAVHEMVDRQYCKLPMTVYYTAVVDVLRRVERDGGVMVTNVLWHHEWQDVRFAANYLNDEARLIRNHNIHVERFFIGEPSHFDEPRVRELMRRNREAGVQVRCLYVDADERTINRLFDQDIGIYDTEPKSFIEGHHTNGYLVQGTVGVAWNRYQNLANTFQTLDQLAYRWIHRNSSARAAVERSKKGWVQPYANDSQPAWQEKPSPMLEEHFGRVLSQVMRRRQSAANSGNVIVIVDAGCGDGRNLEYIAEHCANLTPEKRGNFRFDLIGVDLIPDAIAQADGLLTRHQRPNQEPPRFYARDIVEEIPVMAGSVDILVCADTFGQLYPSEVPHALTEWRRALRPSGTLLLNAYTPNDDTAKDCEESVDRHEPYSEKDSTFKNAWWYRNTYYKYYDIHELEKLLYDAGFGIINQQKKRWPDPPHPGYRDHPHEHENWIVEAQPAIR